MSGVDHLTAEAARLLDRSTEDRVFEIRCDHWVGYPRAKQALGALEDLLAHPRTSRMPNLLLTGPSGIGKTTITDRLKALHPVDTTAEGQAIIPIVSLNMTTVPSETRFWSEMLRMLHVSYRESDSPQRKKNQAFELLAYVRCRLLVIDEIHNVLTGGPREQRIFLTLLKNLSNELGIPLVCVGTGDAVRALHTDTQLSSRFTSFGLRKLPLDKSFLGFLATYERQLPLARPSNLASREIATAIHRESSGGLIGEVTKLIKAAAVAAVRSGEERITPDLLASVEHVRLRDYREQAEVG